MGWGAPPLQREGGAFTCCFRGVLGLLGAGGGPLFREKGGRFTGSFRAHPAPPLGADRGPLTFRSAERGFTCSPLDVPGSGMPSFRERRGPTSAHPGDARSPPSPSPGLAESGGGGATGAPSLPAPPHAPPHPAPGTSHRRRPRAPLPGPSLRGAGRSMARWAVLALLLGLLGSLVPAQGERLGAPGGATPGRATGRAGCWGRVPGGALWAGGVLGTRSWSGGRLGGSGQWGGHVQWVGGTSGGTPGPPSPPGRNALCPRAANAPGRRLRSFCQLSSWACWNSALVGRLTA